jgi:hypothetical protein
MKLMKLMKLMIVISITLGINTNILAQESKHLIYENTAGYPYQQLIDRVDSVKILFSEGEHLITCSVAIEDQGRKTVSKAVAVSKNRFKVKPINACLDFGLARKWLASTLQSSK